TADDNTPADPESRSAGSGANSRPNGRSYRVRVVHHVCTRCSCIVNGERRPYCIHGFSISRKLSADTPTTSTATNGNHQANTLIGMPVMDTAGSVNRPYSTSPCSRYRL